MRRILITLIALVAAMVVMPQPTAHADDCFTDYRVSDDYKDVGDGYSVLRWRLRVDYYHCVTVTNHYDIVTDVTARMDIVDGKAQCQDVWHTFVWPAFRMNPGNLDKADGTSWNPGTHEWECVGGKFHYVRTWTPNIKVHGSADDRTIGAHWTVVRFGANDYEGDVPAKTLG